jgi:hypothetical protein
MSTMKIGFLLVELVGESDSAEGTDSGRLAED